MVVCGTWYVLPVRMEQQRTWTHTQHDGDTGGGPLPTTVAREAEGGLPPAGVSASGAPFLLWCFASLPLLTASGHQHPLPPAEVLELPTGWAVAWGSGPTPCGGWRAPPSPPHATPPRPESSCQVSWEALSGEVLGLRKDLGEGARGSPVPLLPPRRHTPTPSPGALGEPRPGCLSLTRAQDQPRAWTQGRPGRG